MRYFLRASIAAMLVPFLVGPVIARVIQADAHVRLSDNSDWWSASRSLDSDTSIKSYEREASESNFGVLGVKLGFDMFDRATVRLGKATIIERGDAATGRQQACYVSADRADRVYVVFERDEVGFTYYLFVDGSNWRGEDLCVSSHLIKRSSATGSGIRLGDSPSQIIAILGRPSDRRKDELIYSFHVRRKASAEDLRRLRVRYPQLSDKEFHDNYDSYDLSSGFVAKFARSQLTYFSASRAETY